MSDWVIDAKGLSKTYEDAERSLCIFSDVDFQLAAGQSVGILGSSGAGKTTLLNILGGLDKASQGKVVLCGADLQQCSDKAITQLRNRYLGFVYQFHHLLPEFSALENVAMPLYIAGIKRRIAEARASDMLDSVGLADRRTHKPGALSGGERQRVAIARALVNSPRCVLMDEPTGNLDEATARKIQEVMLSLQQQMHTSFVIVTHDKHLAEQTDRVMLMEEGSLKQLSERTVAS